LIELAINVGRAENVDLKFKKIAAMGVNPLYAPWDEQ